MSELPEHVAVNRALWDADAPHWVAAGERLWRSEPSWGRGICESEVGLLSGTMAGLHAIELGCGTGDVVA